MIDNFCRDVLKNFENSYFVNKNRISLKNESKIKKFVSEELDLCFDSIINNHHITTTKKDKKDKKDNKKKKYSIGSIVKEELNLLEKFALQKFENSEKISKKSSTVKNSILKSNQLGTVIEELDSEDEECTSRSNLLNRKQSLYKSVNFSKKRNSERLKSSLQWENYPITSLNNSVSHKY